jgi:hypothetical protein
MTSAFVVPSRRTSSTPSEVLPPVLNRLLPLPESLVRYVTNNDFEAVSEEEKSVLYVVLKEAERITAKAGMYHEAAVGMLRSSSNGRYRWDLSRHGLRPPS